MGTTWVALIGALALSGCIAETAEQDAQSDEEDLTSSFSYTCRAAYGPKADVVAIKLGKTSAKVVAIDASLQGAEAKYLYVADYHPNKIAYQDKAKYKADDGQGHVMVLLVDKTLRSGGAPLAGGKHGGKAIVEGPKISHGIASLVCSR